MESVQFSIDNWQLSICGPQSRRQIVDPPPQFVSQSPVDGKVGGAGRIGQRPLFAGDAGNDRTRLFLAESNHQRHVGTERIPQMFGAMAGDIDPDFAHDRDRFRSDLRSRLRSRGVCPPPRGAIALNRPSAIWLRALLPTQTNTTCFIADSYLRCLAVEQSSGQAVAEGSVPP